MDETTFEPMKTQDTMRLNEQCESMLATIAKWSYFLGILTFVGVGFAFLVGLICLLAGSALTAAVDLEGLSVWVYGCLYIVCSVIYLFPGIYLYRYSVKMKQALAVRDEAVLTEALRQQKNLFVFLGVFSIVGIALLILILLIVFIAVLVAAV